MPSMQHLMLRMASDATHAAPDAVDRFAPPPKFAWLALVGDDEIRIMLQHLEIGNNEVVECSHLPPNL